MVHEDDNKESVSLKIPYTNNLNQSLSLTWRIFHGTHSMLGGLCLTIGSSMYFKKVMEHYSFALTAGGWFLTIGSFFLLLADLQEWWYNQNIYKISNNNRLQHSRSLRSNRLKRNEIRTNFFMAACGSACYVVGSSLLIPTFKKYAVIGDWLIIAGSTIIFLSASWKIYRSSHINAIDPYDHKFRLSNVMNDMSALSINIFVGLGSVFYFLGVMLSLFRSSLNDFSINLSAALCTTGGSFFFLAGSFLQYRYYCTDHQ